MLIGRCAIYERLYLTNNLPNNAIEATEYLSRGLLTLYTTILQALCRLIRVFQGRNSLFPYSVQRLYESCVSYMAGISPTGKANSVYQEN